VNSRRSPTPTRAGGAGVGVTVAVAVGSGVTVAVAVGVGSGVRVANSRSGTEVYEQPRLTRTSTDRIKLVRFMMIFYTL